MATIRVYCCTKSNCDQGPDQACPFGVTLRYDPETTG